MRDVLIAWYFIAFSHYTLNVVTPVTQGPFHNQAQCENYRGELAKAGISSTSCWWNGH